jgi:predicted peptidase
LVPKGISFFIFGYKSAEVKIIIAFLLFCHYFISFNAFAQETSGSFSTQITTAYSYGYLLSQPQNVKSKKPLIVFLHGSGERGADLEKLKIHGPLKYIQKNELDAFVLAPQCPENGNWEAESLYLLIQKIIKENNIDTNRVYLTGLSMGGWGAWDLAFAHAEIFAALVPIASFVNQMQEDDACKFKEIPIRIFHGLLDNVVLLNSVTNVFKNLKTCKADVKLTIFDDADHDSWSRVYDNSEIYDWMMQQVKK